MNILKPLWALPLISLIWVPSACGQNPTEYRVDNPDFEKKLNLILDYDVPLISVDELYQNSENYLLLDTREKAEYGVSHIPNAVFIGYKNPDYTVLKDIDKERPIVTYCSVGYRSEKIGNELRKMGYTKVYNLYGSIFEWANSGYPVVDISGEETKKIHTYNKKWSQWLDNPEYIKFW